MKDMSASFDKSNQGGPGLEDLITLFIHGQKEPLKLLLEPGLEYCRQLEKNPADISMERAGKVYLRAFENGYEPSWQLLYNNLTVGTVLDDSFAHLSKLILLPLWGSCYDI